jgi:UDP-N-acetylglucosamine 3-dehydrogenase
MAEPAATELGLTELRVGLVGLGQMGRHHARVLQAMAGVELVGVADPAGSELPLADHVKRCETLEELLSLDLDLAVVATPTQSHEELGIRLAAAGVHTLIEKPVAADVASGRRMADAFAAAGVLGCVGHIERYNPALQELRRRLGNGDLGQIYQVATRRTGPFPSRVSDVGVILDLATHDVDLTAWVTGCAYRSVTAHTAHRSGRRHEDLVAAVASLDGGIVANHLVNWLSPLKERVTIVSGERGSFVADTIAADLTFFANGVAPVEWETLQSFRGVVQGDVIRYAIAKPEPLVVELEAFRDAALGIRQDVVTLEEATHVVAVAEAMLESAETGASCAV